MLKNRDQSCEFYFDAQLSFVGVEEVRGPPVEVEDRLERLVALEDFEKLELEVEGRDLALAEVEIDFEELAEVGREPEVRRCLNFSSNCPNDLELSSKYPQKLQLSAIR